MAETTTALTAENCVIKLDDENGIPVDISGSSNSVSISSNRELGDYRVFSSKWLKRTENGQSVSASITAVYTAAENEAADLFKEWFYLGSGARTLKVQIPSAAAGGDDYTGEFRLASVEFSPEAGEAGPITVDASLESDGAIVLTTIAS